MRWPGAWRRSPVWTAYFPEVLPGEKVQKIAKVRSRTTYGKMIRNSFWATGYNASAIPLAAGAAYAWGIVLSPAMGAALMSVSTVIVSTNAKLLELARNLVRGGIEQDA